MFSRYCAVATGLLFFAGELVDGQDAQDRTQSFLDDHKSADVTNTDRAITDKAKPTEPASHESTLPPLTGVSGGKRAKVNSNELSKLRLERKTFIAERASAKMNAAESVSGVKAAALKKQLEVKAEKEWENTDHGRELKRMERSAAATGSTLPKLTY